VAQCAEWTEGLSLSSLLLLLNVVVVFVVSEALSSYCVG